MTTDSRDCRPAKSTTPGKTSNSAVTRYATQATIQLGRFYGIAGKEMAENTMKDIDKTDKAIETLLSRIDDMDLGTKEREILEVAVKEVSKAVGGAKKNLS